MTNEELLIEIGLNIMTQDNRMTNVPMFQVQEKRSRKSKGWDVIATTCFTQKGCEDYIRINGHNLCEPRIYVASGYRNAEWELVREHLMQLAK